MRLECPVPGCNNEVDLREEDGVLYWVDKFIPQHHGKVEELSSPLKEQFLGAAYEQGLLKTMPSSQPATLYSTHVQSTIKKKKELPYEAGMLFGIGVVLMISSFLPVGDFVSPYLLYVLSAGFILTSVIEYFAL